MIHEWSQLLKKAKNKPTHQKTRKLLVTIFRFCLIGFIK